MSYFQPKIEQRNTIKYKLNVDGEKRIFSLNNRMLKDNLCSREERNTIADIIILDYFHFLKVHFPDNRKLRRKFAYYLSIYLKRYLLATVNQTILFYENGHLEHFIHNWLPRQFPEFPTSFTSDMISALKLYYMFLHSLHWLDHETYLFVMKEVERLRFE